jgi:hypothetical protein
MGQGFGAVFPVVVVGIVADFLVDLLLNVEIMGMETWLLGPLPAALHRGPEDVLLLAHHGQPQNA